MSQGLSEDPVVAEHRLMKALSTYVNHFGPDHIQVFYAGIADGSAWACRYLK